MGEGPGNGVGPTPRPGLPPPACEHVRERDREGVSVYDGVSEKVCVRVREGVCVRLCWRECDRV